MKRFVVQKVVHMIVLLFGITLVTFCVAELAPGNPADQMTQLNPKMSLEAKEQLMKRFGYDQSLGKRYVLWMRGLLQWDLGHSFKDGQAVSEKIAQRIPVTLLINGLSLFLILLLGIPLGIVGAVHAKTARDNLLTLLVFIGYSMPTFWLALLCMSFFGVQLHWLPISGLHSLDYEYMSLWERVWDLARHLILPVMVSTLTGLAGISRFMRGSMLQALDQAYIQTAWSKGLTKHQVVYGHALRNAVLPIVTLLGLSIPGLIGGSVIFETIFSIPGMGKLMYDSVMSRDMPVYMAILVISAILTLLGNFLADLAYRKVDPRIKYD